MAARKGKRSVQTATSPSTFGFYSGELSSLSRPVLTSVICVVAFRNLAVVVSRHNQLWIFPTSQTLSLLKYCRLRSQYCRLRSRPYAVDLISRVLTRASLVLLQHTNCYPCSVSDSNGLHEVRLWGIATRSIPNNEQSSQR